MSIVTGYTLWVSVKITCLFPCLCTFGTRRSCQTELSSGNYSIFFKKWSFKNIWYLWKKLYTSTPLRSIIWWKDLPKTSVDVEMRYFETDAGLLFRLPPNLFAWMDFWNTPVMNSPILIPSMPSDWIHWPFVRDSPNKRLCTMDNMFGSSTTYGFWFNEIGNPGVVLL